MKIRTGKKKKPAVSVKEMTIAAGNAMKNGFYTEAIWIVSGIMEARLKKILMMTELKSPGAASGIEQHLKKIKLLQTREQYSMLKSHFPSVLITSMRTWKNNRNIMMKDMLEMHISFDRRERMAKEGVQLLKELNKVYKHYKLALPVQGTIHPVQPLPEMTAATDGDVSPGPNDQNLPRG